MSATHAEVLIPRGREVVLNAPFRISQVPLELVIAVTGTCTLDVEVRDTTGVAIADARILSDSHDEHGLTYAITDIHGHAVIHGIVAGDTPDVGVLGPAAVGFIDEPSERAWRARVRTSQGEEQELVIPEAEIIPDSTMSRVVTMHG